MSGDQSWLRRRIVKLEAQQQRRIGLVAEMKKELDANIELRQRELDNLRAQVTIS
jgi:hypothetical protein